MPSHAPTQFLVVTCLLLANLPAPAADPPRDLSHYDVAGPYKLDYGQPRAEHEHLKGQIREFLWTHWRQHRRATVVATYQFIEGIVRLSYYVEPDKKGRWVIVEYTDYPYRPRARGLTFSCAEFERVEPDGLHLPVVVISDTELRLPEQYLLHPICSKGKNTKLW